MKESKEFDIVLMGATGFTGRLVAERLGQIAPTGLRWALAGRNAGKLEKIRSELAAQIPGLASVPIIIADSADAASLAALAQRTAVVISTVGPYAQYGDALVAACVEAGIDYCDLTGEVQWIRKMIDAHHDRAVGTGARIVHCCGFDSIPSDLGTHFLQEASKSKHGEFAEVVKMVLMKSRGGFSGGTVASLFGVLEQAASDAEIRKILGNPYSLNPPEFRRGPQRGDKFTVEYNENAKGYTGPFLMAPINERMVRRSAALLGNTYGEFDYHESAYFGPGLSGRAKAEGFRVGMGAFVGLSAVGPLRKLLQSQLPAPGEGPTPEQIENGFFVTRIFGTSRSGKKTAIEVRGKRDPGYGGTASMLASAALCLALDRDKCPKVAGILTPAVALGTTVLPRLADVGITFSVIDA